MRRVGSYLCPKVEKGVASGIHGRGLVARAPIGRDEIVAIKGGHIVDTASLLALPRRLQNSELKIADGFHLVGLEDNEYDSVMLFLNHSCGPNVGLAGNIVFSAMRDIAAGEELTTDYALFDDSDDEMACQCGATSCRGLISGRDWRRPELQQRNGNYFSSSSWNGSGPDRSLREAPRLTLRSMGLTLALLFSRRQGTTSVLCSVVSLLLSTAHV